MPKYRVVEPHPSATKQIHTGRGGAGNVISSATASARPTEDPTTLTRHDTRPPKAFISGRGGAGNVHDISERAIFSFDEELERQMRREKEVAPVFHIGRGGAGNTIDSDGHDLAWKHRGLASVGTTSTTESGADRMIHRARRSLEAGWGKLAGVN